MKDPRVIFGFLLLVLLTGVVLVIGLGTVTKENSYGLEIPLGCLTTLSGAWSQWAFSKKKDEP